MGIEGNSTVLVVMANGNVYYISKQQSVELVDTILEKRRNFFRVTDTKSGDKVMLSLGQISSIVNKEDNRG